MASRTNLIATTDVTAQRSAIAQFEYVHSVERFLELEKNWEDLESRCACHAFQNYQFLRSWIETAAKHSKVRLAVVLYWERGVLRAVFPGCVMNRMGLPTLTWLGGFFLVDYGDVLFDPSSSLALDCFLDNALSLLRKRTTPLVIFLDKVRDDAVIFPYLQRHFRPYRNTVAPYVKLGGDFEQYLVSLRMFRKKIKSDTLRQIRRLSAEGTLTFRVCERDDPLIDQVIRTFIDQKRTRLSDLGKVGAVEFPGYDEMLFNEARRNRYSHVSYLSVNDEIIAVHVGYFYKNKILYYYMPSFAAEYGNYSPGRVLIYYLLEHCFAHGANVFDFTAGQEPYKYDWTRDEVILTYFMDRKLPTRAARFILYFKDPKALAGRVKDAVKRISQRQASPLGANQ